MRELKGEVEEVHVWEAVQVTLEASRSYGNPYMEVDTWVDLEGPGWSRRVFGFWDGGPHFRVRLVAPSVGEWRWRSGSNQDDDGLNGRTGRISALRWTETEKDANPNRRGFVRATPNSHALEYADGTPFFLLGDTWWSVPTFRYPWHDDDGPRPIGAEMGLKDMLRYRKAQGYNSIAMIAAFPTWANDGRPARFALQDGTPVRAAWRQAGTDSAEDMHNEGGRPFELPGRVPGCEDVVPDYTRLNPGYFQRMDVKLDYLSEQGFVPFIEAVRRDVSVAWKRWYPWPESYARFVHHLFCRCQAYNCILSPIHFDYDRDSIPSREYNEPANLVIDRYGPPPFGNLVSSNAHCSNYRNFGGPEEARWLTMYQTGNRREHMYYWYLTEIFHLPVPRPALNGEPYYHLDPNGWPYRRQPSGPEEEELYCRSGMYGSFLSGGIAGHIYGAMGLWQGSVEEAASPKMWETLTWRSGDQMRHLGAFVMCEGRRYQDLVPNPEHLNPSKSGDPVGYKGWAYCAGTPEQDFFLIYFEKECPQSIFRGAVPGRSYAGSWFDPRAGRWMDIEEPFTADPSRGRFTLPLPPTNNDWGLKLLAKP